MKVANSKPKTHEVRSGGKVISRTIYFVLDMDAQPSRAKAPSKGRAKSKAK